MSKFKVGDWVKVKKPNINVPNEWTKAMDKFDGLQFVVQKVFPSSYPYAGWIELHGRGHYAFHPDWLEPVALKTLNLGEPVEPIRSWVPQGYSVVEMAVPDAMAAEIGEGNALVWKKARVGDRWLCHTENEVDVRQRETDWFLNVIVPTTPPAPKYREPTQADVGKMVEVRDREKEGWEPRELLAVIGDEKIRRRFVCRDFIDGVGSFMWTFARIKIEEPK